MQVARKEKITGFQNALGAEKDNLAIRVSSVNSLIGSPRLGTSHSGMRDALQTWVLITHCSIDVLKGGSAVHVHGGQGPAVGTVGLSQSYVYLTPILLIEHQALSQ